MATGLDDMETGELWPLPERDPEVAERLRAAGVRLATQSLDRPRRVARPRPSWLAFLLRRSDDVAAMGRRILRIKRKPSRRDLELDQRLSEIWPVPDRDPEGVERQSPLVIRPATRSLDRPRYVARPRPAWLAFLIRMARIPD